MPIPVFICGMECGTSGAHWTLGGGAATFSTATFRTGLRSIRLNPAAAATGYAFRTLTAANLWVMRCWFRNDTNPGADTAIFTIGDGVNQYGIAYQNSTTSYCIFGPTGFGSGVVLPTGAWHLLECRVNLAANPWLLDATIDGMPLPQVSAAVAAGTLATVLLGTGSSSTYDLYFDDVYLSNTSADYPIGSGKVIAFSPTRDGVHTGTGTNFQRGNAGTAITSATVNAYLLVDDVPLALNTSDHIAQITSAAAQYVAVGFASATGIPRGVEVIVGTHKATTAVAHARFEWLDGTTAVFRASATAGHATVSGLAYDRQCYASRPTGASWTQAAFDALILRFGYSTDAAPDMYFDFAMLETDFYDGLVPGAAAIGGSGLISAGAFKAETPISALGI